MSITPYALAAIISIVLMMLFVLILCMDAWPFSSESIAWVVVILAFVMMLGFILDEVVIQA